MRQVHHIMGMPITVDIPICTDQTTFAKVFDHFRAADRRFSPYKKYSELSKFNRGEIPESKLSSQMKQVIKACKQAKQDTNGYFDAWYKKDFDPSGYVKGWAIAGAGDILKKLNYKTFCISAGGDILAASDGKKIWRIGIQDPTDKLKILNTLSITNGAVATSGNYERGAHIINPKTGQPATELLSITVTGPDITKADVLATSAFAMGEKGQVFVESKGYQAITYK